MFSKPEEPLKLLEKLKMFFAIHWKGVVLLVLPLILLPIVKPGPAQSHEWVGYTMILMATFWVTEAIPLAVTSFLPLVIFPITSVMTSSEVCKNYVNDTIMMFIGSLILAYSIEQSGLHKRLAYNAMKLIGYSHIKLLLALCIVTTFVSLWITNTAATTMMVPINFAILRVFEGQKLLTIYEKNSQGEMVASDVTTCYFCTVTFSATIGGIGTLIATGTNLAFKGLFISQFPDAPELISFPKFSAFGLPLMIMLEGGTYLFMSIVYLGLFRKNSEAAKRTVITPSGLVAAEKAIREDARKLGKITFWEVMVLIVFGGAMVAYFCRSPQIFDGWAEKIRNYYEIADPKFVQDSALSLSVCFLMLILPYSLKIFKNCTAKFTDDLPGRVHSMLIWKRLNTELPWSYMFLLGGGFALSDAAKNTGLNAKIGDQMQALRGLPNLLVIFILICVVIFFTNFSSNVAVCNIMAPLAMQLAMELNQNPLWYCIVAGFCSSFCFMVPVATPGNLIVQSAAKIPTIKMIKAGTGPTLIAVVLAWFFMVLWAPVIWPGLDQVPEWAKKPNP